MAGTSENVRIWSEIDIYLAPEGATMPTDVDAALDAAFEPVGFIDQDDALGRENTSDDTDHYAYGSRLIRKTSIKDKEVLSFTALENTDLVFRAMRPGSDSSTAGDVTTRRNRPKNIGLGIWACVIEKRDGDIIERECIPRAQITSSGSSQDSDNDMSGKPLMIDQLAVDDGEGGVYYSDTITNDPAAEVAAS